MSSFLFCAFPSFTTRPPLPWGVLASSTFGRAAWVDQRSGEPLDYCSTCCAACVQMHHLVGAGECSLPGCILKCLIHQRTHEETGYCSEDHRVRATARMLVSSGQSEQGGKYSRVFPPLLVVARSEMARVRCTGMVLLCFAARYSELAVFFHDGCLYASAAVVEQAQQGES